MPDPVVPEVADSILLHTKQLANIEADDDSFDIDILSHINMIMMTLNQLGVGPEEGFVVKDATQTWENFIGNEVTLNSVKTYIYYKTRLAFDPPATSFGIASFEKQVKELEYRLDVQVYSNKLRDNPPVEDDEDD